MNFAFYVSGNAGRLRNFVAANSIVLKNTSLVVTDSEKVLDIREGLKCLDIELEYFPFQRGERKNVELSDFILNRFLKHKIDYCFCFGDHILKGELLKVYENKIINFHPSILPMFPGRKAIDKALKDSSTILLGNTAHFIDAGIDTGPIILQTIIPKTFVNRGDYNKVLDLQIDMLHLIYDRLQHKQLIIKDKKVFIKGGYPPPQYFYFNSYE